MLQRSTLVAVTSAVASLAFAPASRAAIQYYDDVSTFRKSHERLVTEDFEAGRARPGDYAPINGAIVPGTASEAFSEKGLKRGFSMRAVGSGANHQLVLVGPGTTPGESRGVGVVAKGDAMEITFDPTSAVGMNLVGSAGPGKLGRGKFRVTVYGDNGEISSQVVDVKGNGTFWGISAGSERIRRISIANIDGGDSVFVDNLTFALSGDTRSMTADELWREIASGWWTDTGAPLGDWMGADSSGGLLASVETDVGGGGPLGRPRYDSGGEGGGSTGGGSIGSPPASATLARNDPLPPTTIPEPAVPASIALVSGVAVFARRRPRRRA